jgi:hypothetical protein
MLNAVITGDIAGSTLLQKAEETKLYRDMTRIAGDRPYSVYRGDSFQLYVKNAAEALQIAFLMRCAAKKIDRAGMGFDIRQSIGIDQQASVVRDVSSAKGTPFLLSGRAFDAMTEKGPMLVISSSKTLFNEMFALICSFADDIFEMMTPKQAEVITELLSGKTQQEAAKKLKKAQPTVNRMAQAARWPRLQELLTKFDYFVKQLSL